MRRDDDFLDAHVLDALLEIEAIDAITISNHEARRFIEWECLDDLLACPRAVGWV